jgi:hypothetical protein
MQKNLSVKKLDACVACIKELHYEKLCKGCDGCEEPDTGCCPKMAEYVYKINPNAGPQNNISIPGTINGNATCASAPANKAFDFSASAGLITPISNTGVPMVGQQTPCAGAIFTLGPGTYILDYELSIQTDSIQDLGFVGIYSGSLFTSLTLDPN